jgi:hypothetical protein
VYWLWTTVLCFATKTRMHYLKGTAKSLALFSEEMPQPSLTSAFSISRDRLRLTESIDRCVEDQAFSPSDDLAPPHPLLPPSSRQQVVALYLSSYVSPFELTDGRGGGAKSCDGEKAWSSCRPFNTLWCISFGGSVTQSLSVDRFPCFTCVLRPDNFITTFC